jgi:hypothetical protein
MKHNRFDGYIIKYLSIEEHPNIVRFVRVTRRTIYINTAAHPGANVVQLIQ